MGVPTHCIHMQLYDTSKTKKQDKLHLPGNHRDRSFTFLSRCCLNKYSATATATVTVTMTVTVTVTMTVTATVTVTVTITATVMIAVTTRIHIRRRPLRSPARHVGSPPYHVRVLFRDSRAFLHPFHIGT